MTTGALTWLSMRGIYILTETREVDARRFKAMAADPFTCPAEALAGQLLVLTVIGGRPPQDPNGLAMRGGALSGAGTSS